MDSIQNITRYRVPLRHEKFPLILFWSQRSGCTRWTAWFLFQIDLLDEAVAASGWIHQYVNRVYKRRTDYLENLRQALQARSRPVVKLVRDPYRRAVSSFLMLSGAGLATNPAHFAHREWRKIREFFYDDPRSKSGIDFLQFLDYLEQQGVAPGQCEIHFAAQFVPGEEDFVTEYARLESVEESVRDLETRFGLKPSPKELFESLESSNRHRMDRQGPPADHLVFDEQTRRDGRAPHYGRFLTPAAIEKISKLFAMDVERYGYTAPSAPPS